MQILTDQQVTRVSEGVTLYAWKKSIVVHDPAEEDLVWLAAGATPPEGYVVYTMKLALHGTKPGDKNGRWGVCWICQREYPTKQMTRKHGHWYCQEDIGDA